MKKNQQQAVVAERPGLVGRHARPNQVRINFWMDEGLYRRVEAVRESLHLWSQSDALRQFIDYAVSQPLGTELGQDVGDSESAERRQRTAEPARGGGRVRINFWMDEGLYRRMEALRARLHIWSRADALRQFIDYAVSQPIVDPSVKAGQDVEVIT